MNINPPVKQEGITDTHLQELFDLYVITTGVRDQIQDFIDKHQQRCEGCGHSFIDVSALQDLQKDSHALESLKDGDLEVCAVCIAQGLRGGRGPAESSRISAEALAEMRRIAGLHAGAYGDAMLTLAEGMERWARQPKVHR